MATSPFPIVPQSPVLGWVNLSAVTACTTRAPTVTASLAAANIIQFLATSTNGIRVDAIQVIGSSSSITAPTAAQTVQIWVWDATTAFMIDEIVVTLVTPSATGIPAFNVIKSYDYLNLPLTYRLYASTTVTTTASTTALIAVAYGGNF